MKRKILCALLALALLSGCAGTGGDTGTAGAFDLAVCLASEPESIDPALNTTNDGGVMLHHFFEGLIRWVDGGDGTAVLAPGQAEDWTKTAQEDGTVIYEFRLRDGICWSDGVPVTAHDFEYAWKRLATPATGADYAYQLDMLAGFDGVFYGYDEQGQLASYDGAVPVRYDSMDQLGVKALDERTLQVTLSYDCPYFEEVCAFPALFPVRQDVIEEYGDQWTFSPDTFLTNGPWVMDSWVHNSYIRAVPNPYYYGVDELGPSSIRFALMDDENAILNAYNAGELDFIKTIPVDEVAAKLATGELKVTDQVGTYYVCFQNQQAPFDDPRVREAFSLAIDRTYLVTSVTQTGETPATAYVPAGVYDAQGPGGADFRTQGGAYWDPAKDAYAENCEKARQLLAEAGYPDGVGFPVVEYLYNTDDVHKAIAEALQNMWQTQLGVTVTLRNQDWNVFLQTRKQGDYSVARNGWLADYNDPMTFLDMWITGGGNNDAQYANPEYDALIAAAKTTSDPQARMDYMHQAEDLLIGQDHALAPLYFYTQKYLLKDDIQGVYYTPLGYFFFSYCTRT